VLAGTIWINHPITDHDDGSFRGMKKNRNAGELGTEGLVNLAEKKLGHWVFRTRLKDFWYSYGEKYIIRWHQD
jgi:acyl-CoA reductase-like NAD-dependent aldehyde dehydrogenase